MISLAIQHLPIDHRELWKRTIVLHRVAPSFPLADPAALLSGINVSSLRLAHALFLWGHNMEFLFFLATLAFAARNFPQTLEARSFTRFNQDR